MKRICLLFACCILFVTPLLGQVNGTLQGVVTDPTGAALTGASVTVSSRIVGSIEKTTTDNLGRYRIANLPLAPLSVQIIMPGFAPTDWIGEVQSDVPLVHDVTLRVAKQSEEVTVRAEPLVDADSSSSTHIFDASSLERILFVPPHRELTSTVKLMPGVVEEENGRMHIRGSEVQPQYVLDGVPIADNLSGIFGTELDLQELQSIQVITGNIPAQFGEKTNAIVNLSTKSGLNAPWNGRFTATTGSFGSLGASLSFGGSIRKFGIFAAVDTSRSHRYMDPPGAGEDDEEGGGGGAASGEESEIEDQVFHDKGAIARLFTRLDWSHSNSDSLHLTLSGNGTDFQIPNSFESQLMGQDQQQHLRDDFESLAWTHLFGARTNGDFGISRRSSTMRFVDPRVTGFPYYVSQERRLLTDGIRAKVTREWQLGTLQVGGESFRHHIDEHFRFAATGPELLQSGEPIAQFTTSAPFTFDRKQTGTRTSLYVQNDLRVVAGVTATVGLRFDHYDVVTLDNAVSPRLGLAYHLPRSRTVFRASYNRLFQTPPLENILLSSAPDAAILSPQPDSTTARVIQPEWQNFYEFGVQQQLGRHLRIDAARYIKTIHNFSDEQQLLATGIVFPVSLAAADIRGFETRLDLVDIHGFSAYASYANARATITTPITGGLFLPAGGEEADSEEGALGIPGLQFPADQDQRNTLQFGTTYLHRLGLWVTFSGRFDSGLPAEIEAGEYPELDPETQAVLDPVRRRLKPRTILNVFGGFRLLRTGSHTLTVQAGVNNLLDQYYLYNFNSVFSGTHVGRPSEFMVRMVWDWQREK